MTYTHDSLLHHNFTQKLPKSINDKVLATLENTKDGKDGKYQGGGKNQGKDGKC
jgi:hypothetical protein